MRTAPQSGTGGATAMAIVGGLIVVGSALGIMWISDGFSGLSGSFSGFFSSTSNPVPTVALASPSASFTFVEGRSPGQLVTVEALKPEHVEVLRGLIVPREDEQLWRKVPWLTNLVDARKKAAADGKPILLWDMDGNPLGCT
jgi:hypothetical protein